MRFRKIILVLKNIIAFGKAKSRDQNTGTEYRSVQHPAEFLLRWLEVVIYHYHSQKINNTTSGMA